MNIDTNEEYIPVPRYHVAPRCTKCFEIKTDADFWPSNRRVCKECVRKRRAVYRDLKKKAQLEEVAVCRQIIESPEIQAVEGNAIRRVISKKNDVTELEFVFKLHKPGVLTAFESMGSKKVIVVIVMNDRKMAFSLHNKDVSFVAFNKSGRFCRFISDGKSFVSACRIVRDWTNISKRVAKEAMAIKKDLVKQSCNQQQQ